jgi:hypothetical protein
MWKNPHAHTRRTRYSCRVLPPLRRPFKERTDMSTTSDAARTVPEPDVAYTPHEHEELRALARAQRERRKVPFVVSAGSTAPKPA